MCMESKTITGTLPKECSRDMDCRPYGCEILTPCGCLRKCIDFVCRCPNEAPPNWVLKSWNAIIKFLIVIVPNNEWLHLSVYPNITSSMLVKKKQIKLWKITSCFNFSQLETKEVVKMIRRKISYGLKIGWKISSCHFMSSVVTQY